jgi:hypothetical protein
MRHESSGVDVHSLTVRSNEDVISDLLSGLQPHAIYRITRKKKGR